MGGWDVVKETALTPPPVCGYSSSSIPRATRTLPAFQTLPPWALAFGEFFTDVRRGSGLVEGPSGDGYWFLFGAKGAAEQSEFSP